MPVAAAFIRLAAMALVPIAVWHRLLHDMFASFHWSFSSVVAEVAPWFLLLVGLLFLVPVAISAGRHPESRLYPRARRAFAIWGTVVYLLGLGLAVQVAALWHFTR